MWLHLSRYGHEILLTCAVGAGERLEAGVIQDLTSTCASLALDSLLL